MPQENNRIMLTEKELLKKGYKLILPNNAKEVRFREVYKENDLIEVESNEFCEIKSSILIGKELKGEVKVYRK